MNNITEKERLDRINPKNKIFGDIKLEVCFRDEELDTKIAKRIMEWYPINDKRIGWIYVDKSGHFPTIECMNSIYPHPDRHISSWKPSTNIKCAIRIINKMKELGWNYSIMSEYEYKDNPPHGAVFFPIDHDNREREISYANSIEEAICLAAIKAIDE
jgi:hypothetical protein